MSLFCERVRRVIRIRFVYLAPRDSIPIVACPTTTDFVPKLRRILVLSESLVITMLRTILSAIALLTAVVSAQPVRVSVKGNAHLFATNAEINRIVDRAEHFLAENMRAAVGHSSFLRNENRSRDVKEALFLTQPMRSPSPFKLSVNERENAVFEAAQSHSLAAAAQGVSDRMVFEHGVAALR